MRLLQCVRICALAGGLMLVTGAAAWAQSSGYEMGQVTPASVGEAATDDAPLPNLRMEASQAKLRNMERQKQLVDDTQKLVALANELKTDVDKSTKDTLSLDVVRKADEIEKLAHNVKERMKNTN